MKTTTTLNINISANDETHGSVSGTQVTLYLIPADETRNGVAEVSIFSSVGPGCPEPAWHSRWHCLGSLPVEYCAESLVEVLESQRDTLEQIAASYLGSKWDGSNHVGRWCEWLDGVDLDLECETYWFADDWLSHTTRDETVRDVLDLGDGTIESAVAEILDDAEGTARLAETDVEDVVRERLEDYRTETLERFAALTFGEDTTYRSTGYSHDVADDQASAGGVHDHCVRSTMSGFFKVIVQSNGNHQAETEPEKITEQYALRLIREGGDSEAKGLAHRIAECDKALNE